MALIQRYTTELSTHASTNRQIQDDTQQILNDIAVIKQQDEDEKRYLNSLNNRLEELLRSLNDLEIENKKLRDDLNFLITSWGIGGENRAKFLQELDEIIQRLSEQNRRKIIYLAETKIFDEQIQVIDRVTAVFIDVINLYQDKCQIIFDLTNELEEELRKIRLRLDISYAQVKSHDDDYQKELAKFRSYLAEWSQLALDKQYLLNEIQSLKEHYNLRLAYNQEEIKEWQRLLNRISQESKNYYRDYLDTIKQQIQMDYEQMAKDQQTDIEIQLKSRLKEIHEKIEMGLPIDENDERRRRDETQRFESRLDQSTKEYDRLQNDYRIIAEEIQHKRRALQDLENELRNKARKNAEQHALLEYNTALTRDEYYRLKDELDKLAYTLRFSVEEELKIYETLLNSFQRKKEQQQQPRLPIDDSKYRQTVTTTRYDTISSGGESTGFRRSQPISSETTRIFTTQTNIDDAVKYRPPPPPLLSESAITTTTTTKTTKQPSDTVPIIRIDQVKLLEKLKFNF
jgi:chromosome segregation ATPase